MIDKNLKQFDISKVSFNKLNHQQIIDFYKNENLLSTINASGSIADITERAIAALSAKK